MFVFPISIGKERFDKNGKSLLVLFGMNGIGVSFECDGCGKLVENRLPVRRGLDRTEWFCSFPCATSEMVKEPMECFYDGTIYERGKECPDCEGRRLDREANARRYE